MSPAIYNPDHNADNPDDRPGYYYVSVLDGHRCALALGPYATHGEALANVERVRDYCYDYDDRTRSWFWAFGTCRLPIEAAQAETIRPGTLNAELAEVV